MKPPKTTMTTEPKNKILLIIIGVLLLTNFVLIAFLLKPTSRKGSRGERTAMIANFLQKEIGFDNQQLKQYDSISGLNRTKVKAMFEVLKNDKDGQFKELATGNFNDTAIVRSANTIALKQKEIEIVLYRHYKEIRNLCSPQQQPAFDSLFYKVLNKRNIPPKN